MPNGATLLDEVAAFLRRFIAFPTEAALSAVTLWAVHAHLVDCFDNTPRLALLSPEPGSGKTLVLEILELIVPAPMHVLSASAAAVFRTIQADRPTLLFDEVDAVFTQRGKTDANEDLRALLNAGYRRGASIPRCVGPRHEVQHFPTFAAVALAGLGKLPDTIMTRSVIIRMRRRAPKERVEPFRHRLYRDAGHQLRSRLVTWAADHAQALTNTYPELPVGITDRPADVWEPLIAIADAAGGAWPDRARSACVELVKAAMSVDSGSLGLRLLADLRVVFADAVALHTETILTRLHKIEEAPWSSLHGRPLDPRGLATLLRAYELESTKVKIAGKALNGYRRDHMWDAWTRYLPPHPAEGEPEEPQELPQVNGPREGSA